MTGLNWISRPDDVDALVKRWAVEYPQYLRAESKKQYNGRDVWALTVCDQANTDDGTPGVIFHKPHAHEPAPIAAAMNIISQLVTGAELDGTPTKLAREAILGSTVLCFLPDAHPTGTAQAPVEAWDGTQYTNEEFWAWMRGIDPETGKMWKRVDLWDDRVEDPLPLRYGIVYEQISDHEYAEPNRSHESTLFKWIFELRSRRQWQRMCALHQTEFVGSVENAMVILPVLYDDQPEEIREIERRWSERIVQAWAVMPDGKPQMEPLPLQYTGEQRQYFVERWGDIQMETEIVTSEMRNNSLLCPPSLQQDLTEAVIVATIDDMLAQA